jgi:chemotaxis protein methyltransferase CheR
MSTAISTRDFDLIRAFIEKETAISLSDEKVYLVETRLAEIMDRSGLGDFHDLHQALQDPRQKSLRDQVIDAMTTNETLWFRDSAPFDAFRDHLLPRYAAEIKAGKRENIRIWSAACSTGQEPYSLGMIFRDAMRTNSALHMGQLDILATDLSETVLAKASAGTYSGIAMERGLPQDLRERHFTRNRDSFTINREIRDRIVFRKFNLQDSFIMMGTFDIILTRYVLIYFQDDFKREVLRKAHGALASGGVLFLGSSEGLPDRTPGYSLVRSGRATWFQKAGGTGMAINSPTPPSPSPPVARNTVEEKPGDGLRNATEDLAELLAKLREINARHDTGGGE